MHGACARTIGSQRLLKDPQGAGEEGAGGGQGALILGHHTIIGAGIHR